MAAYPRAYVVRNCTVIVDGVTYTDQVTKAVLKPDTPTQTLRTYGGVIKDRDTTSWTLEMSGVQDRGVNGLAAALDDLSATGDPVEMTIQPKAGSGQDLATFNMIPVPLEFGAEQGNWKNFEQTFEVNDQPDFTQSV